MNHGYRRFSRNDISFFNEVFFKGFSLSFNITYRFGYYFRKPTIDYGALFTSGIGNIDYQKRWMKPGDESHTNVPALQYIDYPNFESRNSFYFGSEINVLKADNIRLQFINLSYSPPKLKNIPVENLQVYFNASNLGILWRANKENLDPDYPGVIPPSKSFTFGLRANF